MPGQRIVVIGASAGGVEALLQIVESFPKNFPAPIFITLHIAPDSPSLLPQLLSRRGPLHAKHGEDGERWQPGVIYIAPPDRHMLVRDGKIRIVRGPRENRHRPAIDPLFRSAAVAAGPNVIAAVLTGNLDDGTAGALAVKQRGGIVIVQDPAEALQPSMPQSALENVDVDHVLPVRELPAKLLELVQKPAEAGGPSGNAERMEMENKIIEFDGSTLQEDDRPGRPSAFSCPDCGGVLWEIADDDYSRFRCRVGHAFSPESMLNGQNEYLEQALWSALKTLEESARMAKRLAAAERERGHTWMAARFDEREKDARVRADTIRKVLVSSSGEVPQATAEEMEANTRRS